MAVKLWHLPLRLAAGAFILNSGLNKKDLEGEAATGLHAFAASGHPELEKIDEEKVDAENFVKGLSITEMALGSALLLPFVPSWLVGAGLTGFGLGLNRLYWNAPGQRQPGDVRPTEEGIGLAKDIWLTSIGVALVLDAVSDRRAAD